MANLTTKAAPRSLRSVLHSAFSFVRSIESNQATSALTLDHLISQQIQSLKSGAVRPLLDGRGEVVGQRISRWDAIDKLEKDLLDAIEAVHSAGEDPELLALLGIYEVAQDLPTESEAATL